METTSNKMGRLLLPLFIFLISAISSLAVNSYTHVGTNESSFYGGVGSWSSDITQTTRLLTAPAYVPVAADLNNDGIKEAVVLDGQSYKLISLPSMQVVAGFDTLQTTQSLLSQPIITSTLNNTPLVFFINSGRIYGLKYSGSTFSVAYNITVPFGGLGAYDGGTLSCDTDFCIASNGIQGGTGVNAKTYYVSFNESGILSMFNSTSSGLAGSDFFCTPSISNFPITDEESDGTHELVSSFIEIRTGGVNTEKYLVEWISINPVTGTLSQKATLSITTADLINGAGTCTTGTAYAQVPGNRITSPYIADINGGTTGKETFIAYNTNSNDFILSMISPTSHTIIDSFPEVLTAKGKIVSNVFGADTDPTVVSSTYGTLPTVCAAGYNPANDAHLFNSPNDPAEMTIICGSPNTAYSSDTKMFFWHGANFNISNDVNNFPMITHSAQMASGEDDALGENDPTEFITPFGIFTPTYADTNDIFTTGSNGEHQYCTFYGYCGMSEVWLNGIPNMTFIPVESENRIDLFGITKLSAYYFDDGYNNLDCSEEDCISYSVSPCRTGSWQINTSVYVTITPQDNESDIMQTRAILYYGEANEQDSGWTANGTAFIPVAFSFIANSSTSLSTLRMQAREQQTPGIVDTEDITFTVTPTGLEYGDCTEVSETPVVPIVGGTGATTSGNNAITQAAAAAESTFNIPATALWLLLMVIVALVMLFQFPDVEFIGALTSFVEVVLFVLGVYFGFISSGILVALVIFIIFIVLAYIFLMKRGG